MVWCRKCGGFASFRRYQKRLLNQCKGTPATTTATKELDLFAKDELPSYLAGHTSEEPVNPIFQVQNLQSSPAPAPVLLGRVTQSNVQALIDAAKPPTLDACDSELGSDIDGDHLQFPEVFFDPECAQQPNVDVTGMPSEQLANPMLLEGDPFDRGLESDVGAIHANPMDLEEDPFDRGFESDEEPQEVLYRGPFDDGPEDHVME